MTGRGLAGIPGPQSGSAVSQGDRPISAARMSPESLPPIKADATHRTAGGHGPWPAASATF